MDIKADLEEIILNDRCGDEIVANMKKQQDELIIKVHLFNVISLSHKIKKAIEQNFFSSTDIKYFDMECLHDEEGLFIHFNLNDKNQKLLVSSCYPAQKQFLNSVFSQVKDLDINLCNKTLLKYHILELDVGIEEKLLDMFLSEELKKIYDYNKMLIDLPNGNENSKRLKV